MRIMLHKPGIFAIALLMVNLFFVNNVFSQTQTFSTPGTFTFTVPAGVTSITVSAWGGGGAGGGISANNPRAGGGGEGGSFVRGTLSPVTPGATYTVVVGSGGTGGNGTGPAGTASTFGGAATFNAIGGAGGVVGTTGSNFGVGGNTTNTGNVATGTSTVSFYGGNGGNASNASTASSGGGGGSAGSTSNGGNGGTGVTSGGTAGTGGGVAGATGRGSMQDGNGFAASSPGAGGGGGRNANNNTQYTGGNGGNGQVTIDWPLLSAGALTTFGNVCPNTTSGPNSFTITGTNLTTANVTVGALSGYTYSTTVGGSYTSSLSLPQSGVAYSQQIFVKFTPPSAGSFSGNIAVGGGGAASINVAASGTGSALPTDKTVAAASATVCSGSSTNITVASSLATETYQLRNNTGNVNIGSAVTGNGGTISLPTGNLSSATTFNVLATITATGCTSQMSVTPTVSTNPAPTDKTVAAAAVVCSGTATNITVASSLATETYQLRNNSGNVAIGSAVTGNGGTISLPTGNLFSATTFNVLATITATGCTAQMSVTPTVTIGNPANKTVAAAASSVCSGFATNITVALSLAAETYQLRNNVGNVNIGSAVTGNGGTINLPTGNLTVATTFNVLATNTSSACTTQMTVTPTVTVNALPTDKTVAAASSLICSGSSTNITVASSLATETYQLRNNVGNVNIGSAVTGNGGSINLPTGNLPAATTFNVLATITATGCTAQMSVTPTVSTNPAPADKSVAAAVSSFCFGNSTNITVASSLATETYQLRNNTGNVNIGSAVTGNGGTINLPTGNLTSTTAFNVLATITATGCTAQMSVTPTVTVNPLPVDRTVAAASSVCSGSSTNITVGSTSTTTTYQLRNNTGNVNIGSAVTGTSGTINLPTGNLTSTTTFNVLATFIATGCTAQMSVTPTVTVNALPTDKTVAAAASSVCSGSSTNITVASSLATETYQLRNNAGNVNIGSAVTGNAGTINLPTGNLAVNTTFNVLALITATGCTAQMSVTPTVTVSTAATVTPGATLNASQSCSTAPITLSGASVGGSAATGAWSITSGGGTLSSTAQLNNAALASVTYTPAANFAGIVTLTLTTDDPSGPCPAVSATRTITVGAPTIVNYDFNSGTTYGTLVSNSVTGITSTANGPTFSRANTNTASATGSNAFTANTAGTYLEGSVSSGTPINWTFTLAGAAISRYKNFKIYYQAQRVGGGNGSPVLTATYKLNGGANSSASITQTVGTNPFTINGSGTYGEFLMTMPGSLNNPTTSLAFDLGFTNTGTGRTVDIENFQVQAEYTPISNKTVTAQASSVCSGTGTNIQVALSEVGVSYQLRNNSGNANIGSTVAGTGGTINLPTGNLSISTTFNVLASDGTGVACNVQMTNTPTVTVNPLPTITLGTSPSVVRGTTTANLPYTGTTASPDQYSIDYNAAAEAQGFVDVTNASLPATPIVLTVPASANATTYTATISVRNSTSTCSSSTSLPFTVTITPTPVSVTPNTGQSKVYGDADPTFTYSLSPSISVSGLLGRVAGSNVGSYNYTLGSLTDLSGNYQLNLAGTNTFSITARPIIVTANSDTKEYDKTISSAVLPTVPALQGEDVVLTPPIQTFDTKNVSLLADKTITPSGLVINDGNGGNNYTITYVSDFTGQILPRTLTVTVTADNKPYDGNTSVVVHLSDDKISGDIVTSSFTSASFATATAGTNKTVNVSGISIAGADASNYTLNNTSATPTADIIPVSVTNATLRTKTGTDGEAFSNPAIWEYDGGGGYINAGIAPTITNNADIRHNVIFNSAFEVGPGKTLTVSGGNANFNGKLITFKSDATGTASFGEMTGTISGDNNVTVERYIPNDGRRAWRLLSVPTKVSGQTMHQAWQENSVVRNDNLAPGYGTIISTGLGAQLVSGGFDTTSATTSVRSYNGSAFVTLAATNAAPIATTSGYFLFIRGDRTVTNTSGTNTTETKLRTNGTLYTGPQTVTVPANSFTLVGNVYASAINFDDAVAGTGVTRSNPAGIGNIFYLWDSKIGATGGYQNFGFANGFGASPGGAETGGGSWNLNEVNTTIQSGQAFFVTSQPGLAGGTVTMNETSKTGGSIITKTGLRPAAAAAPVVRLNTRLYNAEGKIYDGNVVVFSKAYSNAVDNNDGPKITNPGENFGITREGKSLAVEARDVLSSNDVIYFEMKNMKQEQYSLEFKASNMGAGVTAYLEDSYLGTSTAIDLSTTAKVSFSITADAKSSAANRFKVVFKPAAVAVNGKPSIKVSPNPVETGIVNLQFTKQGKGRYNISLVNITGRTVYATTIQHDGGSSNQVLALPSAISRGTYQLVVTAPGKINQVQKLFINTKK